MSFYADSSFLFSYYASDANSNRADSWRQVHADPLPFSVLHLPLLLGREEDQGEESLPFPCAFGVGC